MLLGAIFRQGYWVPDPTTVYCNNVAENCDTSIKYCSYCSRRVLGEYCSKLFLPKILQELRADGRRQVDVVFDRYLQTSLKSETREKRGGGVGVFVRESTPICRNWHHFLRADKNKEELFTMLAVELGKQNANENTIIATSLEDPICNDASVSSSSSSSFHFKIPTTNTNSINNNNNKYV